MDNYNPEQKTGIQMGSNILLLAEEHLAHLPQLNLQQYPDIMVVVTALDKSVPISTVRQLLTLQLQYPLQISVITSSAAKPNQPLNWAWLLGKLSVVHPGRGISILDNSRELQELAETCHEQGQSVQLLSFSSGTTNTTTAQSAPATITVKKSEYQLQPSHAEPKDPVSIKSMIMENEERRRKNDEIINRLMKKTSSPEFRVIEGKPVSGVLQEQEIGTEHQIPLN